MFGQSDAEVLVVAVERETEVSLLLANVKMTIRLQPVGLPPKKSLSGLCARRSASDEARCPRCLELADELEQLRQRLAASGQFVTYSPGPNPNPGVERELSRWLAVNPRADGAAGFRAGWARLASFVRPRLREWEARWWRMARENDRLRARLGVALREISRLNDDA